MIRSNSFLRKPFPSFYTIQFLGALNDNIMRNALVIYLVFNDIEVLGLGPASLVSLSAGLFILPFFLFSFFSGKVADNSNKGPLIFYTKLAEIVICLLGSIGFFYHQVYFLFFALFIMGVQSSFFGPIKYSILPEIIESPEHIIKANGWVQMGTFLAILLGTVIGGYFIQKSVIIVCCFMVLVACLGTAFSLIFKKSYNRHRSDISTEDPSIKEKNGFAIFLWGKNQLLVLILLISWFWVIGSSLLSLFPVIVKDHLGGGEDLATVLLALFSVGIGMGALLCHKTYKLINRQRRASEDQLGIYNMTIIGAALLIFGLAALGAILVLDNTTFLGFFLPFLLIAIASGFYTVPLYSLVQTYSSHNQRSQVIAANNVWNSLFMVVASLLLAWALENTLTIPNILWSLALIQCIVFSVLYTLKGKFKLNSLLNS